MATATELTAHCSACGAEIPLEARANFCPACGIGLNSVAEDTAGVRRSANRWWATLVVVLLAAGLALGVAMWRLIRSVDPGVGDDEGPAAEAMDEFAPIAEDWIDAREQIDEEAEVGDADGVLLAVEDAVAWTEVAATDVAELAADVEGNSASLYRQLGDVFDERLDALSGLEATGGATGFAAWAAGEAQLDALGAESDDLICQIAGEMQDEGDDADAHITPAMDVDC
jgi:zinc-ribbon domain